MNDGRDLQGDQISRSMKIGLTETAIFYISTWYLHKVCVFTEYAGSEAKFFLNTSLGWIILMTLPGRICVNAYKMIVFLDTQMSHL